MLSGRELLYMSCTGSSRRPKSTIRFGTWTLYRFVLSSLGNYSSFHRIKKYFLNLCTVQCEVDFRALKKVVFIDGRSALMLWVLVEPSIKTRLKSFPTCKFWTRRVPISMGMDGERAIVVASRVFELCWIMICHAIDPCRHISAHVLLVTQLCCQLWKQIDFDLKLSSFFFFQPLQRLQIYHTLRKNCAAASGGVLKPFSTRGVEHLGGCNVGNPVWEAANKYIGDFFPPNLKTKELRQEAFPLKTKLGPLKRSGCHRDEHKNGNS